MSNHFLKRNAENEPVCSCGFRPAVLEEAAPVGKLWKAKTEVLEHVNALHGFMEQGRRSPDDPFRVPGAQYPRAGVRQTEDGRWKLSLWDGAEIIHVLDEPVFDERQTAFDYGWLTIGACRDSGTNLNGLEAA